MENKANSQNHYAYNKQLRPLAHKLRYTMTKAEACLWKYVLKAGNMKGYTFRRQRPVLQHIADFMCKELMLIIEIDGISHQFEDVIKKDIIRQNKLDEAGFIVIRFQDNEVLKEMESVRRSIEITIEEIESKLSTPFIPRQRGIVRNKKSSNK
ncbi:MAG: endonuclease domain-containing protein [Bacteroidia bacterium]